MRQLRVHRDMKHLGSLISTQKLELQLLCAFRSLQTSRVLHISMNARCSISTGVLSRKRHPEDECYCNSAHFDFSQLFQVKSPCVCILNLKSVTDEKSVTSSMEENVQLSATVCRSKMSVVKFIYPEKLYLTRS